MIVAKDASESAFMKYPGVDEIVTGMVVHKLTLRTCTLFMIRSRDLWILAASRDCVGYGFCSI